MQRPPFAERQSSVSSSARARADWRPLSKSRSPRSTRLRRSERKMRYNRQPSDAASSRAQRLRQLRDFGRNPSRPSSRRAGINTAVLSLRAVFTIACEAALPVIFAPPTRHIFVAAVNVGSEIVATRVGKRPMDPADEMAVKVVPAERPAGGAVAGSIDKLDEQLRVSVEALLHPSPPRPPVDELGDLLSAIDHHLDDEASERKKIYNRLLVIQSEMERPAS